VDMEGFEGALHLFGNPDIPNSDPISNNKIHELELFSGFPTLALTGFFQGGSGGFVYDFMVKPFSDMIFEYESGNIIKSQQLQTRIANCYRHVIACGGMSAAKFISDTLIAPNGGVRAPLTNLTNEQKKAALNVIRIYKDLLQNGVESAKL